MSIFSILEPTGVFAPCGGVDASLAFQRPERTLNSAAEVVLSFVSTATFTVNLQPDTSRFPRYLHGQMAEVAYNGTIIGNPDIAHGDRTTISAALVEVVHVGHYGVEVTEIDLSWVR